MGHIDFFIIISIIQFLICSWILLGYEGETRTFNTWVFLIGTALISLFPIIGSVGLVIVAEETRLSYRHEIIERRKKRINLLRKKRLENISYFLPVAMLGLLWLI